MRACLLLSCLLFLSLGGGCQGKLVHITEENWREVLTGQWMVEFFAPWCPACRALQPSWQEFSTWSEDLEINVAQVDVTTSPGLSGRFMVTALPTIFHVKDGIFRQYRGARDKDSFIVYIEEKKWQSAEPVSDWKAPDSLQMSAVSYFFKLSMILRNVHTTLTEEYQLPSWASYIAFAVATILLGGILGLLMVCCIDCIWPPRRDVGPPPAQQQTKREDKKDSDIEDADDSQAEDTQEEDLGSQDEGTEAEDDYEGGSQDEGEGSQDEGEGSQAEGEGSQEEGEEEETESSNKSRRRKPRKAD